MKASQRIASVILFFIILLASPSIANTRNVEQVTGETVSYTCMAEIKYKGVPAECGILIQTINKQGDLRIIGKGSILIMHAKTKELLKEIDFIVISGGRIDIKGKQESYLFSCWFPEDDKYEPISIAKNGEVWEIDAPITIKKTIWKRMSEKMSKNEADLFLSKIRKIDQTI